VKCQENIEKIRVLDTDFKMSIRNSTHSPDSDMPQQQLQQPQQDYNQSVLTMQQSVTITVTPQRSNSLDYLNFEEKRQLIASSLSLSDILNVGPAASVAAKEVTVNTVIGESIKYKLHVTILLKSNDTYNFLQIKTEKTKKNELIALMEQTI
jgi:hypothetical protein